MNWKEFESFSSNFLPKMRISTTRYQKKSAQHQLDWEFTISPWLKKYLIVPYITLFYLDYFVEPSY